MSILKAPPKQPKNATLQVRLDEELKTRLDKYSEFLDSTESYVVSEALKLVFNKDAEFKEWLERQDANGKKSDGERVPVMAAKGTHPRPSVSSAANANGDGLFK